MGENAYKCTHNVSTHELCLEQISNTDGAGKPAHILSVFWPVINCTAVHSIHTVQIREVVQLWFITMIQHC